MLRRLLIGLSTLMILILGVVGMKALKDMREPFPSGRSSTTPVRLCAWST